MAPLITLIVVTVALRLAGTRARHPWPWPVALRGGLAAMFLLTGVVHFVGMRAELISMVPPGLPAPGLLVTITGVTELAGAVGLLVPRTVAWAAAGLTVQLVCMFPANVYAAMDGRPLPFEDALIPRTMTQLVFLSATVTVLVYSMRRRRE